MEPMIRFECPSCGKSLKSPLNLSGTEGKCPRCESKFTVPELVQAKPDGHIESEENKSPSAENLPPDIKYRNENDQRVGSEHTNYLLKGTIFSSNSYHLIRMSISGLRIISQLMFVWIGIGDITEFCG